jgi:hypothetical protein
MSMLEMPSKLNTPLDGGGAVTALCGAELAPAELGSGARVDPAANLCGRT